MAIHRTEMDTREKMRCYQFAFKRFGLHPRWFVSDLSIAIQDLIGLNPMQKRSFQ